MRAMIRDIQNAAEETGAAIVLCGNYTKATVRSELNKGIGASELFNTLRSVLTVKPGKEPNKREVTVSKMSFLGKEVTPVVFTQDEDYQISYMIDEDGVLESEMWDNEEHLTISDRTRKFLKILLADSPLDSNIVKRAVNAAGLSMSTVNRVKEGIVFIDRQSDKSSLWRLISAPVEELPEEELPEEGLPVEELPVEELLEEELPVEELHG